MHARETNPDVSTATTDWAATSEKRSTGLTSVPIYRGSSNREEIQTVIYDCISEQVSVVFESYGLPCLDSLAGSPFQLGRAQDSLGRLKRCTDMSVNFAINVSKTLHEQCWPL